MPEVVCPACGGGFPPRLFIGGGCPWCGQLLITAQEELEAEEETEQEDAESEEEVPDLELNRSS